MPRPRYFRPAAPWRRVFAETGREFLKDDCAGLAAQLGFYFLLAVFPALLVLVALIGYLPVDDPFETILAALTQVAPGQLVDLLRAQIEAIADGREPGLLTIGLIGAIWTSSVGAVAMINALNQVFQVPERRRWWKRRMVGVVLTLALALFAVGSLALIVLGPGLVEPVAAWLHLDATVPLIWAIVRWPLMIGCVMLALDLIYRYAPNRRVPWAWITPGAVAATLVWLLASFGFKVYVANFGNYTATYGAIGGAIVMMMWCYVSGLAILLGAELNAVIEGNPGPRP
jgi:membrane protein